MKRKNSCISFFGSKKWKTVNQNYNKVKTLVVWLHCQLLIIVNAQKYVAKWHLDGDSTVMPNFTHSIVSLLVFGEANKSFSGFTKRYNMVWMAAQVLYTLHCTFWTLADRWKGFCYWIQVLVATSFCTFGFHYLHS